MRPRVAYKEGCFIVDSQASMAQELVICEPFSCLDSGSETAPGMDAQIDVGDSSDEGRSSRRMRRIDGLILMLRSDECGISSTPRNQLVMRALLNDPPAVHDQNEIRVANGAQTVSNNDSAREEAAQVSIDARFSEGVEVTGRFIKHEDRRFVEERPGQCEALALASGQRRAAFGEDGFVSHRHPADIFLSRQSGGFH